VIHEAAKAGKEVFGVEINPAAVKMAQTYRLMALSDRDRKQVLDWVDDKLADALPERAPLFNQGNGKATGSAKDGVLSVLDEAAGEWERVVLEALVILLDFYEECTVEKVNKTWRRLRSTVLKFELATRPVHVISGDARNLPFTDGSIDFVLTSPPYINVFNYHQQYRRSAEAMGWNLLEVAKAEIGSNRKHRGNRLLAIIQYCLDMAQVLHELARVCQEGTRVVVVVGRESNVRKTPFFNGDIVANIAVRSLGWSFVLRQERVFLNRFGSNIFEDILHFAVKKPVGAGWTAPKEIAREVLIEARDRVPNEARADLEEAIASVARVKPSPLLVPTTALAAAAVKK
jgi:ubiquinone/menaquinone biosynthesis C-methylase UbiE